MRVIPRILMLVAISVASASANAGKFDFNSALNSVLKIVLDTSQFENEVSYGDVYDENDVNREIPLDSEGRPLYENDIKEHYRRTEEARKKAESSEVYICDLDNPGYKYVTNYHYDVYYSDEYYSDRSDCIQRHAVIAKETQEKNTREEAERRAKIPKKIEAKIGMTKDQVKTKSRWGAPTLRDITTNSEGTYERWRYYNGTLYFKNGKLTSIEQSKNFLE